MLYDALDKLSAFQRRLIYLLFFRELTQTEVADELGLTQKKVSRESIKALGPAQGSCSGAASSRRTFQSGARSPGAE